MPSTKPHIQRLAFIFDFDLTLATDSWDAICAELGLMREEWERRFHACLGDHWDPAQKKARGLLDAARATDTPLTSDVFRAAADRIRLYPGVLDMPDRIRAEVAAVSGEIDCEFVILSAGFIELIEPTPITPVFDRTYAGAFHYEDGRAVSVKRTITHAEKALYLRAHAEGLTVAEANSPGTSATIVDEHDYHVPFDQITYVGDGASDLQAFGYLGSVGGLTIGIENGDQFDVADKQSASQRVDTLAAADYRENQQLMRSLRHAARAGASRVALRC